MSGPTFSLNLDGTLKKRSTMQDRSDEQPGFYSPRPGTAGSGSSVGGGGSTPGASLAGTSSTAAPPPTRSRTGGATGTAVPSSMRKKYADPISSVAESVAAEEAAIGISDPDLNVILSSKPRLSGGSDRSSNSSPWEDDRAPTAGGIASAASSTSSAGTASAAAAAKAGGGGRRAAAPLATLVGHQNARQQSPSGTEGGAGSLGSTTTTATGTTTRAAAISGAAGGTAARSRPAAAAAQASSSVLARPDPAPRAAREVTSVRLEEAYIIGRTFRHFVASTGRLSINGLAGAAVGATFRQNPSQYVSAVASSGDYVAVGDRTGHVAVMKRRPMTHAQTRGLLDVEKSEDAKWLAGGGGSGEPTPTATAAAAAAAAAAPRTRDLYEFHVGQQAYTSVIDPLNSVEVTPNVSALAFLPQVSPAAYLLTTNEKVPKLYKVVAVRESAPPFRAVDKIDSKTIGPLTASSRASTVAMKLISRYAAIHEYNIHSICPFAGAEQFITADDLTMQLWCTEYPDTPIETYDIRPAYDDEPREAIRCVRTFPHEPFLLFAATSAGSIRVIDVRQTLRWTSQTPQLFLNPPRDADGSYSNVTNSLSDCALSPCGRYIAGRDFMTVCLWDVRVAGSGGRSTFPGSPSRRNAAATNSGGPTDYTIVRNWELHPSLRGDLETLYQADLLFERFDLQFLNHREVCTGGFGNSLYTIDVTQQPSVTAFADDGPSAGVRVFHLPNNEGSADITRTSLTSKPAAAAAAAGVSGRAAGGNTLELGSRITLLSRPTMSLGGTCGMMLCCGQVVMQLSYEA